MFASRYRLPVWMFVACAVACEPAPQPAATDAGPAPTTSAAPSASGVTKPGDAIEEAKVRALVDAWVAAQNAGDLAAYEKLYAQKMEGIKRAGPRLWRFSRPGWVADRTRMFKQPMKVEAKDIKVTSGPAFAVVVLTQHFEQATFQDEGPKQLVVVPEGGELRIAREEMLRSKVAGAPEASSTFRVVMEIGGKHYAILREAPDESWGSGKETEIKSSGHPEYLWVQPAGGAPSDVSAWKGRVLPLYEPSGKSCEGTIRELAILTGMTPHFGGTGGPPGGGDAGFGYLVGELDIAGDCKPAFSVEGGKMAIFAKQPADPAIEKKAAAALRDTTVYKEEQKGYEASGQQGQWGGAPELSIFALADRKIAVAQLAQGEGCSDAWAGGVIAFFEMDKKSGEPKLIGSAYGNFDITALFDGDDNGVLEVFGTHSYENGTPAYRVVTPQELKFGQSIYFPYYDCGC